MKVHWLALLCIVGLALSIPAVSAKIVEEKDGYVVSTADDIKKEDQISRTLSVISSSISQGQLLSYSRYINPGTTSIISDLNWGDTADSLTLTLVAPDTTLGPYYDGSDGQINGRIYLRISKSSGVTPGTWWNRIYGYQVLGSEDFTLSSS